MTTNYALKPACVIIMTGGLLPDGTLDVRTLEKVASAVATTAPYRANRIRYFYASPAGYTSSGGQRVCDVIRLKLLELDPSCRGVEVPLSYMDLADPKVVEDFVSMVRHSVGDFNRIQ